MRFTFQIFRLDGASGIVAPFLEPLSLELASVNVARAMIMKVVDHKDVPAHSVRIDSDDGVVSERWFWLDGEWRHKDT